MKYSALRHAVAALLFCFCLPAAVSAQKPISPKEGGYQTIPISASYAFYNDLDELIDGGVFENATANYRVVAGAYEILIDLGWKQEVLYIDFIECTPAGPVANGIEYKRTAYASGQELVTASIAIDKKIAFYSDEKKVTP